MKRHYFVAPALGALVILILVGFASQNLPDQSAAAPESDPAEDPGYFKQWFERHKNENGIIPGGLHAQWFEHDRQMANMYSKKATGPIDSVICLGPFNSGGRTRGLIVSHSNNNLMFAGGISGGMWKSTNAGVSWTQVNDAAVNLMVSCITQSPFSANTIYYGTGESRANSAGVPGDGIFKSTDGGLTFSQLSGSASISALDNVWAIEHSRNSSTTVYAGTNSGGLYRTTDSGVTWSQVTGTSGSITDVLAFSNGSVLIARSGNGLWRSTTGAPSTFTQITSAAFPASFQRIEIANCKNFPNVVYAAFENSGGTGVGGMCKSSDGGITWTAVTTPSPGNTYSRYCLLLGVSPTDSNKVVCGALGLQHSTNGGSTWSSTPYGHSDHHVVASASNGFFFIGSDGGVHRKHWDSLSTTARNFNSGYVTFQFYAGAFASTGRTCTGGLQDNGTWRFMNGAEKSISGADGGYTHVNLQNNNMAYASQQNGVLRRTNTFLSTTPSFTTITPSTTEGKDFVNAHQINYADGKQLYYRTSGGLWRTIDSGATWVKLNTTSISGIQSIGCTNVSNPAVYIGGSSAFYRFDNAKTFAPGTPVNLTSSKPNSWSWGTMSVDATVQTKLYVGFTPYSTGAHAYKVNGANTATPVWTNISGNLPNTLPVNQIQADPLDSNTLFAATDFGLYYSEDGGATWTKESRIPNVAVFELKLRASDRRLFAFTHGRGVWYLTMTTPTPPPVTGIAQQKAFSFNLFPNPVKDELNITFAKAPTGLVDVEVFSLQGTLVQRETFINTGETSMRVNTSAIGQGIYILRVTNGNNTSQHRLVKNQQPF